MTTSEAKKILGAAFQLARAEAEMCVAEIEENTESYKSALRRRHLKKAAVLRELVKAATNK